MKEDMQCVLCASAISGGPLSLMVTAEQVAPMGLTHPWLLSPRVTLILL